MDKNVSPVGLEGVWEVGEVIGHELCVTIVVIPPYKKSLNLKDEIFKPCSVFIVMWSREGLHNAP